jgi:4'-phosphopantetheinyl transferase
MLVIDQSDYIRCCFDSKSSDQLRSGQPNVEVFYSSSDDLKTKYSELKQYISDDEKSRADRFHFETDRKTYVLSHSLLRLILGKRIKKHPLEISFSRDHNNKPVLRGNPVCFNLTHTREAFALAVSDNFYVGIDLETINPGIDIYSIINSFFSERERKLILNSKTDACDSFFLLWTRKEALLKAVGSGLVNDLKVIEVSEPENMIKWNSLEKPAVNSECGFREHFIYSTKLENNYLSVALPFKTTINVTQIDNENILSYFDIAEGL